MNRFADAPKVFQASFRSWFIILTMMNLLSLFFNNIHKETATHDYTYVAMISNIVLHYLLIFFLWQLAEPAYLDPPALATHQLLQPPPPLFYEWVWHTDIVWLRFFIVCMFILWNIPNFIHCFHVAGFGYLLVIFHGLTLIYWLIIAALMLVSYFRRVNQLNY